MTVEAKDRNALNIRATEVSSTSPNFLINALETLPPVLYPEDFKIELSALDSNHDSIPRYDKPENQGKILPNSTVGMRFGRRGFAIGWTYNGFEVGYSYSGGHTKSEEAIVKALFTRRGPQRIVYESTKGAKDNKQGFEAFVQKDLNDMRDKDSMSRKYEYWVPDGELYHLHNVTLNLGENDNPDTNAIYLKHDFEEHPPTWVRVYLSESLPQEKEEALQNWLAELAKIKSS